MATIFSETLVRLRKAAGFPTAYRFYHGNGGAEFLNITYRRYLAIEQGKTLPLFGRLRKFLLALRLTRKSRAANELTEAWLAAMAGDQDFKDIVQPLLAQKHEEADKSPIQNAMTSVLSQKKYFLSVRQMAVISASCTNHLCFIAMCNDSGSWTPEKLAPFIGLSTVDCAGAMKELAKVKVLKRAGRAFTYPFADRLVQYPSMNLLGKNVFARLLECQKKVIAAGKPVWFRRGILRADAEALCGFFPLMDLNISAAHSYAITERTKHSALYAIEGRVVKLRDF